jgi:ribosome-binding factor A
MGNRPRVKQSRPTAATARSYPRTARLNEALREILADELELLDDDRLQMVTVTGIDADPDLANARVFYSALFSAEDVATALAENRVRLQSAIARQMRVRRTPLLSFVVDPAIVEGMKIESLLASMPRAAEESAEADEPSEDAADVSAEVSVDDAVGE